MATHTPVRKPQTAADKLRAADLRDGPGTDDPTEVLAEVDTRQPLDQRSDPAGALVKADSHADDEFYVRGIRIVRRADTLRFEAQTAVDCHSLLDEARRLLDEAQDTQDLCQVVDPGIVAKLPDIGRRLAALFDGWAIQRGLSNGDGTP